MNPAREQGLVSDVAALEGRELSAPDLEPDVERHQNPVLELNASECMPYKRCAAYRGRAECVAGHVNQEQPSCISGPKTRLPSEPSDEVHIDYSLAALNEISYSWN